ncbi:MAG: hypothetical protein SPL13_04425 [Clostridia bacterium]|nr:hypothetical protein [Clostridia bacterium]
MLEKRKYKRAEVESMIESVKNEYGEKIADFKERVNSLSLENRALNEKLNRLAAEYSLIAESIKAAEEKAAEIEKKANEKYSLEVASIKSFSERFKSYFEYLSQKYPHYDAVKSAVVDFNEIAKIVNGGGTPKQKIKRADSVMSKKPVASFNPQEKINEYIANTGENGFNLDEVLNPGELHLGELCKELGLTEDE